MYKGISISNLLTLIVVGSVCGHATTELPEVNGQFVRIELPGKGRVLSLAEVQVFSKGVNLALKKKATQSETAHSGVAERAVDGNVDGDWGNGSVTHTIPNGTDPWWEVDLGRITEIDEIIVYNRTDSLGQRLNGFTLKVLDANRKEAFTKTKVAQSDAVSFLKSGVKSQKPKTKAKTATLDPSVGDGLIAKQVSGPNLWVVDSESDWQAAVADQSGLELKHGLATPTAEEATFRSKMKTFDVKRLAQSIVIDQSPVWHNWQPIPDLGPANLGDAPVMLSLGPDNYWMFGRYGGGKGKPGFKPGPATLEGFDVPLLTTPFPNQFDAPGGLKMGRGGYHAWQSKDMENWVHHGAVTESFSSWVTTAEYADGKLFIYYDYPNDQDPHLYIDEDLTDGVPGKNRHYGIFRGLRSR